MNNVCRSPSVRLLWHPKPNCSATRSPCTSLFRQKRASTPSISTSPVARKRARPRTMLKSHITSFRLADKGSNDADNHMNAEQRASIRPNKTGPNRCFLSKSRHSCLFSASFASLLQWYLFVIGLERMSVLSSSLFAPLSRFSSSFAHGASYFFRFRRDYPAHALFSSRLLVWLFDVIVDVGLFLVRCIQSVP